MLTLISPRLFALRAKWKGSFYGAIKGTTRHAKAHLSSKNRSHIHACTGAFYELAVCKRFCQLKDFFTTVRPCVLHKTWRMQGCVRAWQDDWLFSLLWRSCFIAWLRKHGTRRRCRSIFTHAHRASQKCSHHFTFHHIKGVFTPGSAVDSVRLETKTTTFVTFCVKC